MTPSPHPSFACRWCDGPIHFERCMDWHNTNHPTITAMECGQCGARHEFHCKRCRSIANHPSSRAPGGTP